MRIKTWRDPHDAGFSPTKPKEIELNTGLTVLVGCNGAGKTTLLANIKEHCRENNIPCVMYNNLYDGGHNSMGKMFYEGNYEEGACLLTASEGEAIKTNIGIRGADYKEFIQNGYINDREYRLRKIFRNEYEDEIEVIECKDRVFLFDAVDSGLSVDGIIEVKDMFDAMLETCQKRDINLYIIISANEYELARGAQCFDVNSGSYIQFKDYEEYRQFILKSRTLKEKRIEQQAKWRQKKKASELAKYKKIKSKQDVRLAEFYAKHPEPLTHMQEFELREIKRITKDFIRNSRFLSEEDIKEESYV